MMEQRAQEDAIDLLELPTEDRLLVRQVASLANTASLFGQAAVAELLHRAQYRLAELSLKVTKDGCS